MSLEDCTYWPLQRCQWFWYCDDVVGRSYTASVAIVVDTGRRPLYPPLFAPPHWQEVQPSAGDWRAARRCRPPRRPCTAVRVPGRWIGHSRRRLAQLVLSHHLLSRRHSRRPPHHHPGERLHGRANDERQRTARPQLRLAGRLRRRLLLARRRARLWHLVLPRRRPHAAARRPAVPLRPGAHRDRTHLRVRRPAHAALWPRVRGVLLADRPPHEVRQCKLPGDRPSTGAAALRLLLVLVPATERVGGRQAVLGARNCVRPWRVPLARRRHHHLQDL
mmetsp:Transcript_15966/g.49871  ORF Transcript_15966/g.49871 Transcript_15966/m.49871 type:complete len:276 (-) Transcript_15966:94-921(-)